MTKKCGMRPWMAAITCVAALSVRAADGAKTVKHWAVEPMSDMMRLPDREPIDGIADGIVLITMAKNEYEPGSFVVQSPAKDLGKVSFALGEFKNEKGVVFLAAGLDLKLVKVWYQNRNAWFCYFADIGDKLCPELLVNDEDLIRVDTRKQSNYARLTETNGVVHELWINAPYQIDVCNPGFHNPWHMQTFCNMKENFKDAATLQPVSLPKGEYRQFFLTAHATKHTVPGTYVGEVKMTGADGTALGTVPVAVRVLPFELPRPKTYVRPAEDFLVASYSYICWDLIKQYNGWNQELMYKQYEAILRNQVEHGQDMHWIRPNAARSEDLREALWTVDVMKKAGMRTDVLLGGVAPTMSEWGRPKDARPFTYEDWRTNALDVAAAADRAYGHHNIYTGYGDEPGAAWLIAKRPVFEAFQDVGIKFILAGWNQIFDKNPFAMDWQNVAGPPERNDLANKWNQLGLKSAWYATMHVGPENPAFNRRQYGLAAYFSGYTALCNYAHHLGPYNDNSEKYRPMVFAYGTGDGVLDTLQWEGFREGIDDIRYATLVKKLAAKACASNDGATRRAGRKALAYFANFDRQADDLAAARSRMTDYILQLRALVGDAEPDPPLAEAKLAPIPPPSETKPSTSSWLAGRLNGCYSSGNFDKGHEFYYTTWTNNLQAVLSASEYRTALYLSCLSNHPETIQAIVDKCVANAGRFKTNELSEIRFAAEVLTTIGGADRVVRACADADRKYLKRLDDKFRLETIDRIGAVIFRAKGEDYARGFWKWRNAALKPAPRKHYKVAWSDNRIVGPESWNGLKLEESVFDRKWKGDLGFLVTDVSTGSRGIGADGAAGGQSGFVTFSAVADEWGLHFRFTDKTPNARQIDFGAKGDGSYEIYLAPGLDTPYACFLYDIRSTAKCEVWNTTYSNAGHRRIDDQNPAQIKAQNVFRDDRVEAYLSVAWVNYCSRIPDGGDPWEFEALRWGEHNCAWNGTHYVHGRSTWGFLDIPLSPAQRARVFTRLLVSAKSEWTLSDTLDYWKDDALGDPEFFTDVVEPEYCGMTNAMSKISIGMDEKTALELGGKQLPRLKDFKYIIDARRVRYAAEQRMGLSEQQP